MLDEAVVDAQSLGDSLPFRSILGFIVFLATALGLSASNLMAADGNNLSTGKLRDLLKGKTIFAHTIKDKTKWQAAFSVDGNVKFSYANGKTRTVSYRIVDGSVCMDFGAAARNICKRLAPNQSNFLWMTAETDRASSVIYDVRANSSKASPEGSVLGGWSTYISKKIPPPKEKKPANARRSVQARQAIRIVPQIGHTERIIFAEFTPDSQRIVSASRDNTIKLWDANTGKLIRSWNAHPMVSAALSPDGRRIASGGFNKTVKLWDSSTGQLLQSMKGHSAEVSSVAFSPDGRIVASSNGELHHGILGNLNEDGRIRLWEVSSGKLLGLINAHSGPVYSVSYSPDGLQIASSGRDSKVKLWNAKTHKLFTTFSGESFGYSKTGQRFLSGHGKTLILWNLKTGKREQILKGHDDRVSAAAFSPDGKQIASVGSNRVSNLIVWDVATGRRLRTFKKVRANFVNFSPDSKRIITDNRSGGIALWNIETGRIQQTLKGNSAEIKAVAFSPSGRHIATGGGHSDKNNLLRIWDVGSGKPLRTMKGHTRSISSVGFSSNGQFIVSSSGGDIKLWDPAGELLRTIDTHIGQEMSWSLRVVALSPRGRFIVSGAGDNLTKIWNAETGKLIKALGGHVPGDEGDPSNIVEVGFSNDGDHVFSAGSFGSLRVWQTSTWKLVLTSDRSVPSVAFSRDGKRIVSRDKNDNRVWNIASGNETSNSSGSSPNMGSVRDVQSPNQRLNAKIVRTAVEISDLKTGKLRATFQTLPNGGWLTITPEGFFAGGQRADGINIVRGFEITSVDQIRQSLFNPDLVREALAGDPNGEVRTAAKVASLGKILDSGPAPLVVIEKQPAAAQQTTDLFTIRSRVFDRGMGVGRIEWRVNGVTSAVLAKPLGNGPEYRVNKKLALYPGDNTIEVIAYNGNNLLASVAAKTTIKYVEKRDTTKPDLHVLAIGIDAYMDRGWAPSGEQLSAFPPLALAVKDAKAVGGEIQRAAKQQYGNVHVTYALDKAATRANLEKLVDKLSGEIHPRDTFILFVAAHGTSKNGRFYIIPQDYQSGPDSLAKFAIGQDHLQDWLANRIKARKAVILLDTCESGALVAGYNQSRADVPASEAGVGRLHEAIGRPVLTAAASGRPALEGYKGHGVFTWAILDALRNGDENGNKKIELSELVGHVQENVPKISAEMQGVGRGFIALAGQSYSTDSQRQSARFGSRGEDYSLFNRLD